MDAMKADGKTCEKVRATIRVCRAVGSKYGVVSFKCGSKLYSPLPLLPSSLGR